MHNTTRPSSHDPQTRALNRLYNQGFRETLGQFFPDGSSVDVVYQPESGDLALVHFENQKSKISTMLTVQGRLYEATQINQAFVRATVFPSRVDENFGWTAELFGGVRNIFLQRGFSELVSAAAAHFVFSTWFPELLPIAPCLSVSGPGMEANFLFDILRCLVRRPLLFGELDGSVLGCLPLDFRPTLLLSRVAAGRKARELLSVSSRRGCQLARGARVVNTSYPRAIYCGTALTRDVLGGGVIPVHVTPFRGRLPMLTDVSAEQIADEFQARLISYRAANHVAVRQSQFDVPELTPQIRILVRALGFCIVGAPEVQAGLKNMLEACDEAARAAHSCELRCIATQVLVSFAHSRPGGKLYIGEITEAMEGIQKIHGETGALEARQIGEILRSLGIHSKRDQKGRFIVLTENMRRQIHELARDFEVAPLEEGAAPCSLCAELQAAPGKTKVDIAESEEAKGE